LYGRLSLLHLTHTHRTHFYPAYYPVTPATARIPMTPCPDSVLAFFGGYN